MASVDFDVTLPLICFCSTLILMLTNFISFFSFSNNPRVALGKKIAKRIRSARKLFKLLKFIDEWKAFEKGYKDFSASNLSEAMR